jgi:transcription initiation factor TFIID TATA-box-binding protein
VEALGYEPVLGLVTSRRLPSRSGPGSPADPLEMVNCIATTDVHTRINLGEMAKHVPHTQYDPEVYYAAIFRHPDAKVSLLVNTSGKVVFSGGRSLAVLKKGLELLVAHLRAMGLKAEEDEIVVRNVVFKARIAPKLQLLDLDLSPWFDAEYEPEQFPGLIVREKGKRGSALLFASGACMLQGFEGEAEARRFFESLTSTLSALGVETLH